MHVPYTGMSDITCMNKHGDIIDFVLPKTGTMVVLDNKSIIFYLTNGDMKDAKHSGRSLALVIFAGQPFSTSLGWLDLYLGPF